MPAACRPACSCARAAYRRARSDAGPSYIARSSRRPRCRSSSTRFSCRGRTARRRSYCDGGVASNSPVGIAHCGRVRPDVVLLDPPFDPGKATATRSISRSARSARCSAKSWKSRCAILFQSLAQRALTDLTPQEPCLTRHRYRPDSRRSCSRSRKRRCGTFALQDVLPLSVAGFNDEVGIGKAYRIGWEDATMRGFKDYDWQTFQL